MRPSLLANLFVIFGVMSEAICTGKDPIAYLPLTTRISGRMAKWEPKVCTVWYCKQIVAKVPLMDSH